MAKVKVEPLLKEQVQAKRRREDTGDVLNAQHDLHSPKRRKLALSEALDSVQTQQSGDQQCLQTPTADDNIKSDSAVHPGLIRDAIESQLGLEILVRHNDLRIINQKLAKAQIALEQLRRCHLIPFPVVQNTAASKLDVYGGTGPALATQFGDTRPQWASPYGIIEGPYSRHYARWLIPDPDFDGVQPDWVADKVRAGRNAVEGRSTRHSLDPLTPGAKSRGQRGFVGQKLQALPSGYPPSKEKAGPSVLKRPDGQLVKLVCLDCRREDFGSTQGFINHCRIAHKREFKSHEEAAVQSGVPIELDEVGGILGDEKVQSAATGLVHPLIRSASTNRATYVALLTRINQSMNMFNQGKLPGFSSVPGRDTKPSLSNPGFVSSSETPNLSAKLRRSGFSGNLDQLVSEAKQNLIIEEEYPSDESDAERNSPHDPSRPAGSADTQVPAARVPARALMPLSSSKAQITRPESRKGLDSKFSRKPVVGISPRLSFASPANTAATPSQEHLATQIAHLEREHSSDEEVESNTPVLDAPTIHDLSPNTSTSNNAPSLVSDDGEYDDGDDDAESSFEDSQEMDDGSDVAEIDVEDGFGDDKVLPSTALRHRGGLRKEEKHVTFVSPVKERRSKTRSG